MKKQTHFQPRKIPLSSFILKTKVSGLKSAFKKNKPNSKPFSNRCNRRHRRFQGRLCLQLHADAFFAGFGDPLLDLVQEHLQFAAAFEEVFVQAAVVDEFAGGAAAGIDLGQQLP